MLVAEYYKQRSEEIANTIKSRVPFLVVGMCESGKNLTYRQVQLRLQELKLQNILLVDLVGVNTEKEAINVNQLGSNQNYKVNVDELDRWIQTNYSDAPTTLLINLGDNDSDDNTDAITTLINLRASLGTKFSFGIFSYINLINLISSSPNLNNLNSREVIKLMPLDEANSLKMIDRNEKLFDLKLSKSQKKNIHSLSGGNPGLIKALTKHIYDESHETNSLINDRQVKWRLERIVEGLTDTQLNSLKLLANSKDIDNTNLDILEEYGFIIIKDGKYVIFSKLLEHFLKNTNQMDNIDTALTATEHKLFDFFTERSNKLVDREEVAQVIWGKHFLDSYSDYAIDRHISNLRKKVLLNNFDLRINTLKGKGFKSSIHN